MAVITLPFGGAPMPLRGLKWRCRKPAQRNRSKWTNTSKVVGLPGAAMWSASGDFPAIASEVEALPWMAFFGQLDGVVNSFALHACEAQQTAIANPTVAAGATSGDTLPLTGLPASTTILAAGRKISVTLPNGHQRLAILETALVSNAGGNATAQLDLELGLVPAAGAAVEIRMPYSLVSLKDGETGWDIDLFQYGFSIDVEEAM